MDSASKRPASYRDGPGDAKKARSGFADNVLLQAVSACLYDKGTLHSGVDTDHLLSRSLRRLAVKVLTEMGQSKSRIPEC